MLMMILIVIMLAFRRTFFFLITTTSIRLLACLLALVVVVVVVVVAVAVAVVILYIQMFHKKVSLFETENYIPHGLSMEYGAIVLFSAIFWWFLYLLPIQRMAPQKLVEKWNKDLQSRVISSLHAIYASGLSCYFFYTCTEFSQFNLTFGTKFCGMMYGTVVGYFLYDWILIMSDPKQMGGYGMLLHHAAATIAILIATIYNSFQLILLLFALTEITTPFINMRTFLLVMGMEDSIWYALNGICVLLGFLGVRFSLVFAIPWILYSQMERFLSVPLFLQFATVTFYITMSCLNTFWTWKIMTGLVKLLFSKVSKHDAPSGTENRKSKDD
jgi:hypothetical protein